jgi:hypothetical protein
MAWLFRVFAWVSLIAGLLYAVVSTLVLLSGPEEVRGFAPLYFIGGIVSALIGFIIWLGLAEGVVLVIALERNTRQTRDRLPRHHADEPLMPRE